MAECLGTSCREPAVAASGSALTRHGVGGLQRQQPLGFKTSERRVQRADRDGTTGARLDLLSDARPVGVGAEARDGQHDVELELGKEEARHDSAEHYSTYECNRK